MALGSVRGDVGAELRPVQPAVDRLMHVLRAVVNDARVVRIDLDRRLADEAEHHVLGILAVALLWVNPEHLLLPGRHVYPPELAFAVAIDDLSRRNRPNLSALAAGQR